MKSLILKELFSAIFLLFCLSFCIYLVAYLLPTDAVYAMFSRPEVVSEAIKEQISHKLGLERPFLIQYFSWLKNALCGNFGYSLIDFRSINELFNERFLNTIILNGLNLILLVIFSLIFGIISALNENKFIDHAITFISFGFVYMPSFWIALVAIMVFSVHFGIFPTSGLHALGDDSLKSRAYHIVLPLLVLFVAHIGLYIRVVRSSFLISLKQPFVFAMFARGVGKFEIYKGVLKHSLVPIISYIGANFVTLITGSYIIESIFLYPGLGELAITSILSKDYSVILAVILLTAVFAVFGNLFAKILCIIINRGQKSL
ncbi:ABC transporter permease [Campylobacter sp. RM12327]|uniref:ABC transporter permease n=1 Tax=Campylobacter sputorum TaxID=206 RepID=UPI00053BE3BF|nr:MULTISPECIES: ABC transporter permease [Campylobacter]ASM39345.1 dipeptide/oligopeptide/nickel ABC transporter, permease protein [Campylobacter sputorum]MBE7358803.1 ABC transporter permease [Campylobacter sp. RM11302]MBF6670095.1 ABC transporter permease [Campylobacter sp. RM12327]MBF6675220.1 ABC transporter permease [Campylobacter sp. RM13538]MBF6676831.1 ABC transporter permease [Campylobacter sp. RM12321]